MTYKERQLRMKVELIKGLAGVEGDITFDMTGYDLKRKEVTLSGTYWGGIKPKGIRYIITKDHFEMLEEAETVEDVIRVYESIGYYDEPVC